MTKLQKYSGRSLSIARFVLLILTVLSVGSNAYAATYYISSAGNDGNQGTSPATPWKTFTNVSAKQFHPGDLILLKGGDTFSGTLTMNSSGSPQNPICIGSYGQGQATINAGSDDGIDVTNASYVRISDLTVYGTGGPEAYNFGISFVSTTGSETGIAAYNVTSYGFGIGVSVETYDGGTYTGVNLSNINAYNNNYWGIFVQGYNNSSSPYSNISNVTIDSGTFYGDGAASKSAGSGVLLTGVNGAVIKHSTAYNNGDIGFWCYSANNIVFTHDTAYGNLASNGDGGFDLDIGTTNSTIEYSYAHNNAGEGFELCGWNSAGEMDANLTVRYNISENDRYPIAFAISGATGFSGVSIYNNTIYTNLSDGLDYWAAFNMWYVPGTNIVIANNLVWNANPSVYDLQWASGSLTLNFDAYYGSFAASFDGTFYNTLNAFQTATGLESNGVFGVDPEFVGTPGTKNPSVYKLSSRSALLDAGTNLRQTYGIDPGHEDFYGNPVTPSSRSIGAYARSVGEAVDNPRRDVPFL